MESGDRDEGTGPLPSHPGEWGSLHTERLHSPWASSLLLGSAAGRDGLTGRRGAAQARGRRVPEEAWRPGQCGGAGLVADGLALGPAGASQAPLLQRREGGARGHGRSQALAQRVACPAQRSPAGLSTTGFSDGCSPESSEPTTPVPRQASLPGLLGQALAGRRGASVRVPARATPGSRWGGAQSPTWDHRGSPAAPPTSASLLGSRGPSPPPGGGSSTPRGGLNCDV